ncbi:hypothetical protein KFK09_009913 [Dendrobium nobile]|uniref:RING-type E3 ubiquitin transferase n=1 Tax=Dendrobium nobile TaxID=94219 RepID=A0A8T3BKU0_DENNO|nr:hypothetical protein KFK09_009913 [Dendrobium nobile]
MVSPQAVAVETLFVSIAIPLCSLMLYILVEMAFQSIKLWLLSRRFPGVAFHSSAFRAAPEAAQQRLADLNSIAVDIYQHPAASLPSSSSSVPGSSARVNEPESCAVCLADYEVGDEVKVLPACKHVFHGYCIDSWLFASRVLSCPVCRCKVFDKMPERTERGIEISITTMICLCI